MDTQKKISGIGILADARRLGVTVSLKSDGTLHMVGDPMEVNAMRPMIDGHAPAVVEAIIITAVMHLARDAAMDGQSLSLEWKVREAIAAGAADLEDDEL